MMASFDVVTLFTNIPRDLAVKAASQCLALDEFLQDRNNLLYRA